MPQCQAFFDELIAALREQPFQAVINAHVRVSILQRLDDVLDRAHLIGRERDLDIGADRRLHIVST